MWPAVNASPPAFGVGSRLASFGSANRIGRHHGCVAFRELLRREIKRLLRMPLSLGGFVVSGSIIMYGAGLIAVGGAIGARQIFDPIGQIGGGIAQALRIARIAEG